MEQGFPLAYALSTAAGLRPFLTLALTAWMMQAGVLTPSPAFAWLGHSGVCILLSLLAIVEFGADKIPVLDHALHGVHFAAKPIAAALVAGGSVHGASTGAHDALLGGVLLAAALNALGIHVAVASARAASTVFSLGMLNPIVSLVEDVLCVVAIAIAILLPIVGVALALIVTAVSYRATRAMKLKTAMVVNSVRALARQ